MESDVRANVKELENYLKIKGCPSDLKEKVKEVVKYYWDLFCEYRFHRPIWGFPLHIDTGNHPPIFCKPTRYSPHKSEFMWNLVGYLDKFFVVEEDDGPWRALVFLSAKPHQEMCLGTITSGGYLCPTKNWTGSLAHSPSPYLDVTMHCRTFIHKKSIILQWIWTVGIGE